jgi:hypothetical protein
LLKEIRTLRVALATGRHAGRPPSDTYSNFPLVSSRKPFSISSPYILPHFTTPCNVRTWGLMTCKIRVVTELVLQPAESSFTVKGSFLLQQHPLACYSRIGNEKFVRFTYKIPIVLRKSLLKYPANYPANRLKFYTEYTGSYRGI